MRRRLAAIAVTGLLAGAVLASSLTPAEATHTLAHLRHQISRLENQVSTLQSQVRKLNNEVYNCERIADYPGHRPDNGSASDGYVRRLRLLVRKGPRGPASPRTATDAGLGSTPSREHDRHDRWDGSRPDRSRFSSGEKVGGGLRSATTLLEGPPAGGEL